MDQWQYNNTWDKKWAHPEEVKGFFYWGLNDEELIDMVWTRVTVANKYTN